MTVVLPNGANAALLLPLYGSRKPADLNANGNGQSKDRVSASDGKGDGSLLSIYGTTLTPGGALVTVTTNSNAAPLTFSFDLDNHIIHNAIVHALATLASESHDPSDNSPIGLVTTITPGNQRVVILSNDNGGSNTGTT